MKTTLKIAVAAVTLGLGAALTGTVLAGPLAAPQAATAQPGLVQSTLYVKGMSCEDKSCSTAVALALHRMAGVKRVHIAEMQQLVTISYDPKQVSEAALVKTVDNAGYPARVVKGKSAQRL